MLFKFVFAI